MLNQRMPSTGVIEVTTNRKGEVVMAPGRYTLRLRTARAVFEGTTVVQSGQTREIRRNQLNVVPYGRTVRKGYREDQQAVLGVIAGGVATGAITEGVGPNFGAVLACAPTSPHLSRCGHGGVWQTPGIWTSTCSNGRSVLI